MPKELLSLSVVSELRCAFTVFFYTTHLRSSSLPSSRKNALTVATLRIGLFLYFLIIRKKPLIESVKPGSTIYETQREYSPLFMDISGDEPKRLGYQRQYEAPLIFFRDQKNGTEPKQSYGDLRHGIQNIGHLSYRLYPEVSLRDNFVKGKLVMCEHGCEA